VGHVPARWWCLHDLTLAHRHSTVTRSG